MYTICNCKLVAFCGCATRLPLCNWENWVSWEGSLEYTRAHCATTTSASASLSLATLKMQFSDVVVAAAVSVAGGANDDLVRFVRYYVWQRPPWKCIECKERSCKGSPIFPRLSIYFGLLIPSVLPCYIVQMATAICYCRGQRNVKPF